MPQPAGTLAVGFGELLNHMVTIILSASKESEARAKAAGFKKQEVLIRHDGPPIGDKERKKMKCALEYEMMSAVKPNQFLVGEYWGACPD